MRNAEKGETKRGDDEIGRKEGKKWSIQRVGKVKKRKEEATKRRE